MAHKPRDGTVAVRVRSHARPRAERGYLTVAVGRDYADVAPTSGTFEGTAPGVLSARKASEPGNSVPIRTGPEERRVMS